MPAKLLAISFAYPPANSPRAVQIARLLRHTTLPTTLICAGQVDKNDRIDPKMVDEAEAFLARIVRVPFSVSAARKFATRVAYPFGLAIWEQVPDSFNSWKHGVLSQALPIFENKNSEPDVMVTFGAPMSDHLIGLELRRRYGVPWIAHFSDPWADNSFKNYNWLTGRINTRLERQVIEAADHLLFTSSETITQVMSKYPAELSKKASVLTHAYEPQSFSESETALHPDIVVRFLGDMYGPRTPAPLFNALSAILESEDADILKGVRFEFVGSMCDLNLTQMGFDLLPEGLVRLRETVGYKESLALMRSADGLLVIDAPAEISVFLPSKLIDYIGAARPVLGITPLGTAANLIAELGGWTANPSDDGAIKEALNKFLSFLRTRRAPQSQPWGNEEVRSRYECHVVARKFQSEVEKLASVTA